MENIINILKDAKAGAKISETTYNNVKKWLTNAEYREYHDEIAALINAGNFTELEDTFHTIIPFGTGGRRGTCGIGTNRINARTIGESAQGLAAYISRFGEEAKKRGVVIAYDTRNTSLQFAEVTAKVLVGNGVKTYLFKGFRSTPELSFAVRKLGTIAGIVITASHNPPNDNGFKVYWKDGGQIVAPHDKAIIQEVNKVTVLHLMELDEAEQNGLFEYVGKEVDETYIQHILDLVLTSNRNIKIVYSPLHGTGQTNVLPVLQRAGFQEVYPVEKQMIPDGGFPYVKDNFPNPERLEVLEMPMKLAKKVDADIGLVSDPDADRLGVFCKQIDEQKSIQWVHLNGNQVGVLLADFVLNQLKEQGKLPEKGVVMKTMVTSDLISVIAKDFGMSTVDDLLVGFKHIGELIDQLPPDQKFILGAEESVGYLRGTFARDKDAATAALTIAEFAAILKTREKTLYDRLNEIYRKYGYYHEILKYVYFSGADGVAKVTRIMDSLRTQPLLNVRELRVTEVIDRRAGVVFAPETGEVIREVEGKKANVLVFVLSEDGHTRLTVRPSGTEPTMKYYGAIRRDVPPNIATNSELEEFKTEIRKILQVYIESFVTEAEKRG